MAHARNLTRSPASSTSTSTSARTRARPQPRITRVDLLTLPQDQREALIAECLTLDQAVFPNATDVDLEPHLRDPRALAILMVLMRSPQGRLVGQVIHPIVPVPTERGPVAVMGGIAGILPEWRGAGRSIVHAVPLVLGWALRNPRWRLFFATALMTPKVYEHVSRSCPRMHPRPGAAMPPELQAILRGLAQHDPTLQSRGPHTWVRDKLPPPRGTAQERRKLDRTRPHINFFLDHVPDYAHGRGLMSITPLSAMALVEIGLTSVWMRVARRVRRWMGG